MSYKILARVTIISGRALRDLNCRAMSPFPIYASHRNVSEIHPAYSWFLTSWLYIILNFHLGTYVQRSVSHTMLSARFTISLWQVCKHFGGILMSEIISWDRCIPFIDNIHETVYIFKLSCTIWAQWEADSWIRIPSPISDASTSVSKYFPRPLC